MNSASPEDKTAKADTAGQSVALDDADLDKGRRLFAQECRFVAGAARFEQLPPETLPEVAFAGRSNVGKSSLMNALVGRRALARTSQTPGRTQQLNFFVLGGRLTLVDLPGYGYAQASKKSVRRWTALARDYLKGRSTLRRVCLLVDARHGLKDSDRQVMLDLDKAAVSYQVVLTKTDKCSATARERTLSGVADELARRPAAYPTVQPTSALKGQGIAELRATLATLATADPTG